MKTIPYSHQSIDELDIKEVIKVLKSDWITQGPAIEKFESRLCKYTGAKYAVAVSSGTAALHIACLAAGIKHGDEVITSPITFVASANCILYCGGKPVFADIQKDTVNIAPEEIKKKVNKKTKAIIPVHFAGHPCDLEEIRNIAKEHNLVVIEDAAHALGAEYKGSQIGSCKYSDMAILSFHPVKSITTGEGGAVLTNRKDLYERLTMFRNHGITKKNFIDEPDGEWYYEMKLLGYNYRMTDIHAALGISQLKKLDDFILRRREIARAYDSAFKDNQFFDIPIEKEHVQSAYHLYAIRLKDEYEKKKKNIFGKLRRNGLGVQVHYIPVYQHPYYKKLKLSQKECRLAEDFYQREISIPIYSSMAKKEVCYVIDTLLKILQDTRS